MCSKSSKRLKYLSHAITSTGNRYNIPFVLTFLQKIDISLRYVKLVTFENKCIRKLLNINLKKTLKQMNQYEEKQTKNMFQTSFEEDVGTILDNY